MPILTTRIFNDTFLAPYRQIGDKAADAVVENIATQKGREGLVVLMQYLGNFDNHTIDDLSSEIQDFFRLYSTLPSFSDLAKMEKGMAFFWRNEQQIPGILACYSLPYCYAAANGAQVLWLSQRIKNDTLRRLEETGLFVYGIMQERDWRNGKNAIKILKIRLMHAVIRYFTQHYPQWNTNWGLPINQEDMAGTNLAFSYIVIKGLRKMGGKSKEMDEEAFLHFWNVVGSLLGGESALLPQNLREAYHLDRAIAQRQFRASEAGIGLTKALTNVIQQQVPDPTLRDFPVAQMRFLLGNKVADLLGIDAVDWAQKTLKLTIQIPIVKRLLQQPQGTQSSIDNYKRS